MKALSLLLASLGMLVASVSFAECGSQLNPAQKQLIDVPEAIVAYEPSSWPIAIGKHFSVKVQVCPKQANSIISGLKIDADMPAHKHGMNYKPKMAALGDGAYLAQGLMFHMPGVWRIQFEFDLIASPDRKVRAFKEHVID